LQALTQQLGVSIQQLHQVSIVLYSTFPTVYAMTSHFKNSFFLNALNTFQWLLFCQWLLYFASDLSDYSDFRHIYM